MPSARASWRWYSANTSKRRIGARGRSSVIDYPPYRGRWQWCVPSGRRGAAPRRRLAPAPLPPPSGPAPLAAAHQLAARQLVGFAPGLDALRLNAEVEVAAREVARVEAGLGGE